MCRVWLLEFLQKSSYGKQYLDIAEKNKYFFEKMYLFFEKMYLFFFVTYMSLFFSDCIICQDVCIFK